jgi:uncharacterized protein (TIGR02118 family)
MLDLKRKARLRFSTQSETFRWPGNRIELPLLGVGDGACLPRGVVGYRNTVGVITNLVSRKHRMSDAKLMVMYPLPKNVDAFEKIYQNEHVPLAVAKLGGKTKIVATKMLGSQPGIASFYRIAEVYFPSMQALEACAASDGGKEAIAHTVKISSGRAPIFLVAEEETIPLTKTVNT